MLIVPYALFVSPAYAEEVATSWHYAGPAGESDQDTAGVVKAVLAAPDARHYVWLPGWPAWKSWDEVPELKTAVDKARAPAPAPAAPPAPVDTQTWSYSDGGAPQTLATDEVAARLRANPSGRHLVWKPGMAEWAAAASLPEFAAAKAPPPPPTASAPPPPPPASPPPPMTASNAPPPPDGDRPPGPGGRGHPRGDRRGDGEHRGMAMLKVKPGGEIRADLGINDLGVADTPAAVAFDLARLRPALKAELGEHWAAKVSLDVEQGSVQVAEDGSVTKPSSWGVKAHDAWVQGQFTTGKVEHSLRMGGQETTFGSRGYYDQYDNYYIPGHGYKDLPRLFGAMYGEDLGVAWHSGLGEKVGLDLQLMNGGGITDPNSDGGLDFIARISARPIKYLGLWGSLVTGGRETAAGHATQTLADIGVEGRFGPVRVYGEGLFGGLGNPDFYYPALGYLGAAAVDIPVPGEAVDHVTVVGRYAGYDPIRGNTAPDSAWTAGGAANLYWKAEEKQTLMTGLGWQMDIPQNLDLPVTHDLVLQFAAKF